MGALYIRDPEADALASEVSAQMKTTKTEAVKVALRAARVEPRTLPTGSTTEWLRAYRHARPLPNLTKMRADKAFFDWLSGEEDVQDVGMR